MQLKKDYTIEANVNASLPEQEYQDDDHQEEQSYSSDLRPSAKYQFSH
jgi:hypothetical protein